MRNSSAPGAPPRRSPAPPIELERAVLRELCRAKLTRREWSRIERALHAYAWRDVEHGLVYAAIERLAPRAPQLLRDELPAQATRLGFPDIEWQGYFRAEAKGARPKASRPLRKPKRGRSRTVTASRIERLIGQLIGRMQKTPA